MSSFLDIIQSVVVAGIIILLVFSIHLMTMRTGTENRVIQEMQGIADATVTILQEEIRFLHSFASDSVRVHHNSLLFRNTAGDFVYIETGNDSLTVIKSRAGIELASGTVAAAPSSDAVVLSSSYSLPDNAMVRVSALDTGVGQTKIVESFNSSTRLLKIKGTWDMQPTTTCDYRIFSIDSYDEQLYHLDLLNQSPNITTFNLRKLNPDGSVANIAQNVMSAADVDLISVSIVIKSREEDLYQDQEQEFTVNLQKDFFLRGYRLPSVGG